MYVAVIPNRGSPPAILLRESYREGGKTKNRTVKNLSDWPAERIEQLRAVLRGEQLLPATDAVEIVRALPHGHVLAALGTARRIELDALLPRRAPQRRRDLALALIVARLLDPAAKLATARLLDAATASDSLGGAGQGCAGEAGGKPAEGRCWGSAASPPRMSTPRWIGWAASKASSKPLWPAAT